MSVPTDRVLQLLQIVNLVTDRHPHLKPLYDVAMRELTALAIESAAQDAAALGQVAGPEQLPIGAPELVDAEPEPPRAARQR